MRVQQVASGSKPLSGPPEAVREPAGVRGTPPARLHRCRPGEPRAGLQEGAPCIVTGLFPLSAQRLFLRWKQRHVPGRILDVLTHDRYDTAQALAGLLHVLAARDPLIAVP